MEKIQVNNDAFILYSPDSLKFITDNMGKILETRIEFYKKLFDIEEFRKVQINYFDNIDSFKNFIYDLRGEKESLPKYAAGTFDKGMINAFINPNIISKSPLYYKKQYMAAHELFHIMYKELISDKENKQRIVWFDEGMAQLFSGEKQDICYEQNFEKWYENLKNSTKEIPNLNNLNHGDSFVNDNYNGYNLSFLAVKYLYDNLGINEFKTIMHDNDKISSYGDNIIDEAMNYYDEMFQYAKSM